MRPTHHAPSRRGGKRAGAGRKRSWKNRRDPRHTTREELDAQHPVHVMLRTRDDVPRLRQRRFYDALRKVLRRYVSRADFGIVHISIQHNHLHLIVEAANALALTRGMQSFAINTARAINRVFGRKGKVFAFRYKAKQIRTRDYARNAIAYVLNNWRHHNEDHFDPSLQTAWLDPYSSAISFHGWKGRSRWLPPEGYLPLPVSWPRTALLSSSWQWYGLIDPREQPGRNW